MNVQIWPNLASPTLKPRFPTRSPSLLTEFGGRKEGRMGEWTYYKKNNQTQHNIKTKVRKANMTNLETGSNAWMKDERSKTAMILILISMILIFILMLQMARDCSWSRSIGNSCRKKKKKEKRQTENRHHPSHH